MIGKHDLQAIYAPLEAFTLVKKLAYEKFDASIEVHVRTGIDPRKSDQTIRGSVTLPHGSGKVRRVAVFAEGEQAAEAKAHGAELVGSMELINEIKQSGKADFDIALATPEMMRSLASVAKILGPKGLMPSPKNETVSAHIGKSLEEIKKGRMNFKNDDTGNVHFLIGRASFSAEQLTENYQSAMEALRKNKPSTAKGTFVVSIIACSTMGPSIRIAISS